MRTKIAVVSLLVVFAGCGEPQRGNEPELDNTDVNTDAGNTDGGDTPPAEEFCDGDTTWLWDPPSKNLYAFPDDYFTIDDATSLTGVKVDLRPAQNVIVPPVASNFGTVFSDVGRLDGFSINGAAYLRFSGPLNRASLPEGGLGSASAQSSIQLVSLNGDTIELLDFTIQMIKESGTDDSTTLVVKPLVPLAPASKYALVATNALQDASGHCVAPSSTFASLFDEEQTEPGLVRLASRYESLVTGLKTAGAITSVYDLSAAVVFTTQSVYEVSAGIAADIRDRTIAYQKETCSGTTTVFCEGVLKVGDYRQNMKYIPAGTPSPTAKELRVSIWMPATDGPHPVVLYAHGLGGDRMQAEGLGGLLSAGGWAVVAVDAPKHGEHYDAPSPPMFGQDLGALELFGAEVVGFGVKIDTRRLTDNFRQAAYDKLQLVQALTAGIDADGDGTIDLNADELVYSGVSLGGIMAPELLALAPEFDVAVPMVPGARLADIVDESSSFQQGVGMLLGNATAGERARLFAVFQAAIDRADPGSWGPKVTGTRLAGLDAQKPQVLMQMVINDDVVPNSTNGYYARSLGLELAGDELLNIEVPRIASLPASGNLASDLTGAVYQLDVGGNGATLNHSNASFSDVSAAQVVPFIESYYSAGASTVIDSYRTLNIK